MNASTFREASEAAESWLNTVSLVAQLGEGDNVDAAYRLLLPGVDDSTIPNLQDSYSRHCKVLNEMKEELAEQSDSPVWWKHGRGRSAIARVPEVVYPHVWSSAHEAAAGIAQLALQLLVDPLREIADRSEQWTTAERLLPSRTKALVIPLDEVADLQERIRRERAKVLADVEPPLEVTLADLETITLRLVKRKTLRNGRRPKPVGKKGQANRYRYSEWVDIWPEKRDRLPDEAEARRRLAEAASRPD